MKKKITNFRKDNIIQIADNRGIIAFCISFIIVLFFLSTSNVKEYGFGDAAGYWGMSTSMIENGLLNFKFIPESGSGLHMLYSVRGYAWPFLIAILRLIGLNSFYGWLVTCSLFISVGYIYIISRLFDIIFEIESNVFQKLFPLVATIILWPGLILYPLSDIPSMS